MDPRMLCSIVTTRRALPGEDSGAFNGAFDGALCFFFNGFSLIR